MGSHGETAAELRRKERKKVFVVSSTEIISKANKKATPWKLDGNWWIMCGDGNSLRDAGVKSTLERVRG